MANNNQNSHLVLIIGENQTGKSTLCEKLIDESRTLIYDINGEYKNGFRGKSDDFIDFVYNKGFNKTLLFEEAQIYFTHRNLDERLADILNRKRHRNNSIICVFLELRAVPLYLLTPAKYIFLFKTGDMPKFVEDKFRDYPELIEAHREVLNNKDFHFKIGMIKEFGQWKRMKL